MGGTGGFFNSDSPGRLADLIREGEEESRSDAFETEVGGILSSQLASYNDRDVAGINTVLDSVKVDLEAQFEGTIDMLFGGSVAKHTYVNGLSDVDALVLIDRAELRDKPPADIQRFLVDCLGVRYGKDAVYKGVLAVTVTVGENTIQLLPALRDGEKFKIASYDGNSWSRINPTGFTKALTKANKAMNGKLVPCVKLVKAIIAALPEQRRLTGYHTEALAIKIFKAYDGPKTPKAMVRHFFETAPRYVKEAITDSSGQSIYVDEYLGGSGSLKRHIVADALNRMARRIRNADGAGSVEQWQRLFE